MRCFRSAIAVVTALLVFGTVAVATAQSPCLLAQAAGAAQHESFAVWVIRSLGSFGLLTILSGAAIFIGACAVAILTRRPAVIAAYLVFLPFPLLFGVMGALKGNVASFAVIAMADVQLKPSQYYAGMAETMLLPLVALMVTMPSYLVIANVLFVRTIQAEKRASSPR